ncbi:MAG: hypothetical protein ACP5G2_05760 [Candidatus Bipolaricaulaceae bacterium]
MPTVTKSPAQQAVALVVAAAGAAAFACLAQSPCDYTPPESHLTQLELQADLRWYDDPWLDDRSNLSSGTLLGEYVEIQESPTFGYTLTANGRLTLDAAGYRLQFAGSANAKQYWEGDTFGSGGATVRWQSSESFQADVTGGVGVGRFRDVTPLAKAIRIQNSFLDQGVLVGPLSFPTLQELAHALGDVGLTGAEKLALAEQLLEGSGLVENGTLGARELLHIEGIIAGPEEAHLCGWEVQGRAGVTLRGPPPLELREAVVVTWKYALVPDPVSQWMAPLNWISGLDPWTGYALYGSFSYARQLGGGWQVQAAYDYSRDFAWSGDQQRPQEGHLLAVALRSRLSPQLDLSLSGEMTYRTGDQELSTTVSIHLAYDVF